MVSHYVLQIDIHENTGTFMHNAREAIPRLL